jgi:uncharacterized protein YoxC
METHTLLTLSGSIISIMMIILGFFLSKLVADIRKCIEETGKNKGRIDLIAQQQQNDVKRIEETTQTEIRSLSKNVQTLSVSVQNLVTIVAEGSVSKNGKFKNIDE